MKKITLGIFLVLFAFTSFNGYSQCPGCNIDTTLTSPGIYPVTLPTGTQTVPYSQDVTFVMFTDTSGFHVNYFKILSVSGLPFGLHWECNNSAMGCQYDPSVNLRGCVKMCGVPLQTGFFTIDVNLVVNLSTVGNQYSTTQLFVQIDPMAGGNPGFSFTPATACDSALVNFTGLIDGAPNPTTYNWNFGNGNTSTLQNPPTQLYSAPGDYVVSLQTDILGYKITDVNLFTVNSNWAGDVEEPNTTFFSPDPYFEIYNSLAVNLYTSPWLSNTESGSWSGLNIILTDPPYSINIWDDDNISANDNLGSFPFTVSGPGTIPFSGAGGTSGNMVVATYVVQTFLNYDTIHVYAPPAVPTITFVANDSICVGDSVMLTASGVGANTIQWFNDTASVLNGDTTTITVNTSGNYWAQITNPDGCTSNSVVQNITVVPNPLNPTFLFSGNVLTCYTTGYQLQWYLNGVAIPGADSTSYVITVGGNYSVVASNAFGCSSTSITVLETYEGIDELDALEHIIIYPNPSNGEFNITADQKIIGMNYIITDNIGRTISQGVFTETNAKISLAELEKGVYFLNVKGEAQKTFRLIRN